MTKIMDNGKVLSQDELSKDIFSVWIRTDIAKYAAPGQFVNVYTKNPSKLLPRPVSICEADKDSIRLVYRVTGKDTGTAEFSKLEAGDDIKLLGPLGNGFPTDSISSILIGGGIGIPPMLELAKKLEGEKITVLGFRDSDTFLVDDLSQYGRVYIASEDGSIGTKGNVLDAVRKNNLNSKRILACGPAPMLRAIKKYAFENNIECFLSLEEKMACGIGACLACTCKSSEIDSHSKVKNKRVCTEGPVFNAFEVEL